MAISEPVISLGESFLILDDWQNLGCTSVVKITEARITSTLYEHIQSGLTIPFTAGYQMMVCTADWMTKEEQEYMVSKYQERHVLVLEREERDRLMSYEKVRQRFTDAFCKKPG